MNLVRLTAVLLACALARGQTALPEGPWVVDVTLKRTAEGARAGLALAGAWPLKVEVGAGSAKLSAPGRPAVTGRLELPAVGAETTLRLARLDGRAVLSQNGRVVARMGSDAPLAAAELRLDGRGVELAVDGVQPLEPPFASDDFLRDPKDSGGWEPQHGAWTIGVYRDPLVAKYGLPPQATWYQCEPGDDGPAVSLFGHDFWADLQVGVDLATGADAGVVFAAGDDGYGLFRLRDGKAELVEVGPAGERVCAAADYQPEPDCWARLTVISSDGYIRAAVNERWLLWARMPARQQGRIGLWSAGRAQFDNLRVEDARLVFDRFESAAPEADGWREVSGPWAMRSGALAGWSTARSRPLLASALRAFSDGEAAVRVQLPKDGAAGLGLLPTDGEPLVLALRRTGAALSWELVERGGPGRTLRSGPLASDAASWHELALRRAGALFEGRVDGRRVAWWYDKLAPAGAALAVLGPNGALFDEAVVCAHAVARPAVLFATDFQGMLPAADLSSGEGKSPLGFRDLFRTEGKLWQVPPPKAKDEGRLIGKAQGDVAAVWYRPELPGDAGLAIELGELSDSAELSLVLNPEQGYELHLAGRSARLTRAGKVVDEAALSETAVDARIWTDGAWVAAEVDGHPLIWHDPEPCRVGTVGLRLSGGEAKVTRFEVTARRAAATRFDAVDTAWREDGPWRWSSGMACIVWSYWITGDGREHPATLWRREGLAQDLFVRFEVSEYTDGYDRGDETHQHYSYHDVSLVLDGDGADRDSGYRFLIGADGGHGVKLFRRGQVVAENKHLAITMGSHCNTPRDILVEATRQGATVKLCLDGAEMIAWDDPEPLSGGGHVALGVEKCRANFRDFSAMELRLPPS